MTFLQHIPIYVFVIFFGLLFLWISQMKTKEKPFRITTILPIAMLCFALYGVYDVGLSFISSLFLLGIIWGFFAGKIFWKQKNFIYQKENDMFKIIGSKIPFFLMMFIFFTKFFVWIMQARNPELLTNIFVFCGIILLYGVFSGIFLQRLFLLIQLRK